MKCPICKKEVKFNDPFMPFCSDRCKEIDLGNWASEKYVIPGDDLGDDLRDELPPDESSSIHSPGREDEVD
jgi:endogenous inhibitor of DNA gyrase (YacG/DUF329 family)